MHKDDTDLARRLFATALAKLEDATHIACRGQSADITPPIISREAKALEIVAQDLAALSGAILALTHGIDTTVISRRKKSH
ncbi:MAG: hypothetical protein Q8M07_08540 [Prosthecobacter sp.]|nr:hypothetical protein [Prosthecobacter sp.]